MLECCRKDEGDFGIDEVWLTERINAVVVDRNDRWRSELLNDILAKMGKQSRVAQKNPEKMTIFTVGPVETVALQDVNDLEDRRSVGEMETWKCEPENGNSKVNERTNLEILQTTDKKREADDKTISTLAENLKTGKTTYNYALLNDRELMQLMNFGHLKQRDLEEKLGGDLLRAVSLRRLHLSENANIPLQNLPFQQYDYSFVHRSCCENVIGYVPIPTGIVGPLLVNGRKCYVPMSTTEGALIASTNRGCRAIFESDGVMARVYKDGMTRAPVIQFESAIKALEMKNILDSSSCFEEIRNVFDSTSNFAKLKNLDTEINGRLLFLRFEATTGDAMGMNMVSKGVNAALSYLNKKYPEMEILSLSGNYCVDKKASAINWIKGRGKSVIAEATVSAAVVERVLKTTVDALVRLGQAKLMIGSSMAGTIGGWNAHAANVVAAIFIATGQDVAQVVSSSMCLTTMEKTKSGDLYISCNMRCLEVGTVGGGTILPAQNACLQVLGCGSQMSVSGECAKRLAEIICSTVLAGELSLMAAQCSNDLVKSHIRLNRSTRCLSKTSLRPELNATTCEKDEENKVKIKVALRKRSSTEKPVKFEMQCSNIL